MSILSLNWFKSQKQKQTEALLLEVAKMQLEVLKKQNEVLDTPKAAPITSNKIYRKLKLVDSQLTIVLHGGEILTKSNATQADFIRAKDAKYESELLDITGGTEGLKEQKEQEREVLKAQLLMNGIEILEALPDFEVREGSVYLKNAKGETIERSMPQVLVEQFIQIRSEANTIEYKEHYEALKKFWLKCCLNPNAQSAEDLYKFLQKHQFKIDKHGNFYAYRRVDSRASTNKEYVDFISNAYNKVKAVWKKNPISFTVLDNEGTLSFVRNNQISKEGGVIKGILKDLYDNLPNLKENTYTSRHTGEEDYKVGEVISMPRDIGDDNNKISCSKGFHAASKAYDYSGFGDTPILVIINPMDVLAVPLNEDGKLRTCRWFFAMTLPVEEQHILDDEAFDTMELGDVFEEKCSFDLQEYVQNSFAEEVKRHTFTIPKISATQINTIIQSLDDMRETLSKRVVQFE